MINQYQILIIGFGITGQSISKYLRDKSIPFLVFDTNQKVSNSVSAAGGVFLSSLPSRSSLSHLKNIFVSPGINLNLFEDVLYFKDKITNDIDIFFQNFTKNSAAVTGTNGKTTVVNTLSHIIEKKAVGNIGQPIVEYIRHQDDVVIELSSFQLDYASHLKPTVASVLNVTPDHMDRYTNFKDYFLSKMKLLEYSEGIILPHHEDNIRDYIHERPELYNKIAYTVGMDEKSDFYFINKPNKTQVYYKKQYLFDFEETNFIGQHNALNCLHALALAQALGYSLELVVERLMTCYPVEHRMETIGRFCDKVWINDSKATNVHATLSAVKSIGQKNKCVVILGGSRKNTDYKGLLDVVSYCRAFIFIGETKYDLYKIFNDHVQCSLTKTLKEAILVSNSIAHTNDIILLSPASASFDMFKDYKDRGRQFKELCHKVLG